MTEEMSPEEKAAQAAGEQRRMIAQLAFELFNEGKGAAFLTYMRKTWCNSMIYPIYPNSLQSFGDSNEVYAGFKAGQANVVKFIEDQIATHKTNKKPSIIEN